MQQTATETLTVVLQDLKAFGTVGLQGIHQVVDDASDIDNALYNAERDNFDRVFLYVEGLHTGCIPDAQLAAIKSLSSDTDLNPWRAVSAVLNSIYAQISEALTFKQYKQWRDGASSDFHRHFQAALKVSKSKRIAELATQGILICQQVESIVAARSEAIAKRA